MDLNNNTIAYKVDFKSKNDVDLLDTVMFLYSRTVLKEELSLREKTALREYLLYGYSLNTKKAICLSLGIRIENLNTLNCSLQKKGFLRPHQNNQRLKIISEELLNLKKVFLDSQKERKLYIINFER